MSVLSFKEVKKFLNVLKKVKDNRIDINEQKNVYVLEVQEDKMKEEQFLLDIYQGSISLKHTIQKRVRTSLTLVRLDTKGNHVNPEFTDNILSLGIAPSILALMKEFSEYEYKKENHVHLYLPYFDEKWAFPPERLELGLTNNNLSENIKTFCDTFNIEVQIVTTGLRL